MRTTLLCLAFLIASSTWAQTLESSTFWVLHPGQGIGDIKLGANINAVVEHLQKIGAKLDEGVTVKRGKTEEYWLSNKGATFVFDKKRKLIRVSTANPLVLLDSPVGPRVRIGNPPKEITGTYGTGEQHAITNEAAIYGYPEKGIYFTINPKNEKVTVITIAAEGTKTDSVAVAAPAK